MSKARQWLDSARKIPARLKLGWQAIRAPYFKWVPPGHFYSPLPDMKDVLGREAVLYAPPPAALPGIELNGEVQTRLLNQFQPYYADLPFDRQHNPAARFSYPNGAFPFQDAFTLYAMIRHFRPTRLIEVGCGFSSSVMLDTCEALNLETRLTFIDPYPDTLLASVRPGDLARFDLRRQPVQAVSPDLFAGLQSGDMLFIDSSHVSKIGSDVNFIFFEVLPRLNPGVLVHFHDVFYPFEYPREWLFQGIFWNETYLLRAFLMFNPRFQILLFNSYLNHSVADVIKARFPLCLQGPGGSLWLRRAEGALADDSR